MPAYNLPEHPSPQLDELPTERVPADLSSMPLRVFVRLSENTGAEADVVRGWLRTAVEAADAEGSLQAAEADVRTPAEALGRLRRRRDRARLARAEAATQALGQFLPPQVGRFLRDPAARETFDNLSAWGGTLPAGIAVCDRCSVVFRPASRRAAYRCPVCHGRKDSPIQGEYRTNAYGHLEMPAYPVPLTPKLEALGFTPEHLERVVVGVCQRTGCDTTFHVRYPTKRHCSDTCRQAAHKAKGRADRRSAGR